MVLAKSLKRDQKRGGLGLLLIRFQPSGCVNDDRKPFIHEKSGSIVVEAAISLPFFLTFILSLIVFIQLTLTEMVLHTAVSETVKQIATHYTPIHDLLRVGEEKALSALEKTTLPPFLQALAMEGLGMAVDQAMPFIIEPYLKTMVDERFLTKERLRITSVLLPKASTAQNAFLEVEVEYRTWIRLPFFEREITIRKKAIERVWLGGRQI